MKSENLKEYSDKDFRRITGVKRETFEKMVEILHAAQERSLKKGGRKPKLSIEEKLLATLEYLREYRTLIHISASYGVSESNLSRIIKRVEDTLIKDGSFSLPGRKALLKSDMEYEVILIDATESPIERPKKSRSGITPEKGGSTH